MFKKLIFILCVCVLAGCGLETYQRGDLPNTSRLASIKKGASRDQVIRVLGPASYTSDTSMGTDNILVYAQTMKASRVFADPKTTAQDVYVYYFDRNNTLINTQHVTMDDMRHVSYDNDITPVGGKEMSVWAELIDNFGKYDAGGRDSSTRQ